MIFPHMVRGFLIQESLNPVGKVQRNDTKEIRETGVC